MNITLVVPRENARLYSVVENIPSVGLASIAAVLQKEKYKVNIIDAYIENLSPDDTVKRVLELKTDVVGISLNIQSYEFASQIASLLNKNNVKVVVGGPEVTLNTEKALNQLDVDAAITGEGEYSFLKMLEILKSGDKWSEKKISNISGVAFKTNDNEIIKTPFERITNLDDLPFLAYEKFNLLNYELHNHIVAPYRVFHLFTSRGCPFNCSFCSSRGVWGRQYYYMSAERVVAEVEHLIGVYQAQGIYFHDDNFTLNTKRVVEICELLIAKNIKTKWMCLGRAQGLDLETLKLMKRAGCKGIWFGIESGSKRVLNFLRKEIDIDKALITIKNTQKAGLAVIASIMIGVPTETKSEIDETVYFLKKAKPTFVYLAPYVGYPGSDLYENYLTGDSRYIYSRIGDIVLPNSYDLTWPEKNKISVLYNRKFNFTINRLLYQLSTSGIKQVAKKIIKKIFAKNGI